MSATRPPPPTDPGPVAGHGEPPAVTETRAWLEHAVIGLGLCPFAPAVVAQQQVRFATSTATEWEALRLDLCREMALLAAADPGEIETTLLVCTHALADFDDYNDFLDVADDALRALDLEGELQIASFHPRYRFEGTTDDDVTNATNRSPWPVLQLLREASIERVLAPLDDPDDIVRANLATMEALGEAGWAELAARWAREPGAT